MTCVISCKEENLTRPGIWWNQILQVENAEPARIMYVRYACMHCDQAPCIEACPNRAIYQRADGIVLVDKAKCGGVGACVDACPYDVLILTPDTAYFADQQAPYDASAQAHRSHPPGKASMCTMCAHRVDQGRVPSCVAGCPSRAMIFGDLDDPADPIQEKIGQARPLQGEAATQAKVSYVFPEGLQDCIEATVKQNPRMPR